MDEQDQTIETPVADGAEPASAATTTMASGSPLARPLPEYVVRGTLSHDGVEYREGSTFRHPDEALIAHLRKLGTLVLPEELMAADDLAKQAQEREALVRQQQDEIEALRRQIAVLNKGGKGK